MGKRIRKHIKKILQYIAPAIKEKTQTQEGGFPLNINNSDRISWSVEINAKGEIVKIANISYEININENWIWIIRYDDHGGNGNFHRHERMDLKTDSDIPIFKGVRQDGTKQSLTQWAINDIRENYLAYRKNFLTRNGIAMY